MLKIQVFYYRRWKPSDAQAYRGHFGDVWRIDVKVNEEHIAVIQMEGSRVGES